MFGNGPPGEQYGEVRFESGKPAKNLATACAGVSSCACLNAFIQVEGDTHIQAIAVIIRDRLRRRLQTHVDPKREEDLTAWHVKRGSVPQVAKQRMYEVSARRVARDDDPAWVVAASSSAA